MRKNDIHKICDFSFISQKKIYMGSNVLALRVQVVYIMFLQPLHLALDNLKIIKNTRKLNEMQKK